MLALALAASLATAAPAAGAAPASGVPIDPAWSADPVWDDGLAEITLYDAERVVYGKPRPHDLTMIVVKEEFDDASHVKADPPYVGKRLTAVLKLNLASTVATENYPYHFLTSVFGRRDDVARLVKASAGSQEWCGNTYKEIRTWGEAPAIEFHSYFDGEGDGSRPVDLGEDGLLDEQMLLVVRAAALADGATAALRVAEPITSDRAGPVVLSEATLTAAGTADEPTALGSIRARKLVLRKKVGGTITYWVEASAPRALLRMEASDGRKLRIRERARRDYWSRPPR